MKRDTEALPLPDKVKDGVDWWRWIGKVYGLAWVVVNAYVWYRFDGVSAEDVVWTVSDVLMVVWVLWR